MARATTTSDAFNAVAEPQRREILDLLARGGERSVNDIARSLHARQPQISKHLRVLREVGLVSVRASGKQRFYRLTPEALKPIQRWVTTVERVWNGRLDRLDDYLHDLQQEEINHDSPA